MDILNYDLIALILNFTDTITIGKCLRVNKKWLHIIRTYSWMFKLDFTANKN